MWLSLQALYPGVIYDASRNNLTSLTGSRLYLPSRPLRMKIAKRPQLHGHLPKGNTRSRHKRHMANPIRYGEDK